jgi:hypothetical protein
MAEVGGRGETKKKGGVRALKRIRNEIIQHATELRRNLEKITRA